MSCKSPARYWLGSSAAEAGCLALNATLGFIAVALSLLALDKTSATNCLSAAQATPLFAAGLSCVLLGERVQPPELLALACTSAGALLLFHLDFVGSKEGGRNGSVDVLGGGTSVNGSLRQDAIGVAFALTGSLSAAAVICLTRAMGTSIYVPWPKQILALVDPPSRPSPPLFAFFFPVPMMRERK